MLLEMKDGRGAGEKTLTLIVEDQGEKAKGRKWERGVEGEEEGKRERRTGYWYCCWHQHMLMVMVLASGTVGAVDDGMVGLRSFGSWWKERMKT